MLVIIAGAVMYGDGYGSGGGGGRMQSTSK